MHDVPSEVQETLVAARVPNLIVVPKAVGSAAPATLLARFVPVIVTMSPPATSPVLGETEVMVGRWALPEIFHRCPWAVTGTGSGKLGSSPT